MELEHDCVGYSISFVASIGRLGRPRRSLLFSLLRCVRNNECFTGLSVDYLVLAHSNTKRIQVFNSCGRDLRFSISFLFRWWNSSITGMRSVAPFTHSRHICYSNGLLAPMPKKYRKVLPNV